MRSAIALGWVVVWAAFLAGCASDFKKGGGGGADSGPDDAGPEDAAPENHPPVAVDDSAETRTEDTVEIRLIENDTDPDGDDLIISEVVQPENGFVQIMAGDLRVEYTSLADFVGVDEFTYTVSDQVGGTDQGSVAVNVEEVPVLTLDITSPEDAAIVEGPDITVSFEITGCAVTRPSSDPEGCHLHRYIDGAPYEDAAGPALG
jgi:hypothetical protein